MSVLVAAGAPSASWYLTRATGVVALLLLTGVVVLGVAGAVRWRTDRWPRFLVAGLHRNLTLLALTLLAIHVLTTVVDGYTHIGLADAFLPFRSSYRPLWLGLGALAFDLLLALTITSLVRARVGYRAWRFLHWLAYVAWPLALVHGLGTGSDARAGWMRLLALGCAGAVLLAVLRRALWPAGARTSLRFAAAGAAAAVAMTLIVWFEQGPNRPGWARRAGTPAALLGGGSGRLASAAGLPAFPFTAALRGNVGESVSLQTGLVTVAIAAVTRGSVLRLDLQGRPLDAGGVAVTGSRVAFGPPGAPPAYTGTVTALAGDRVQADLSGSDGRLRLSLILRIDLAAHAVGGTLRAQRLDARSAAQAPAVDD
jgi:sulfoxide reductase heme-binding subunit YedZ